MVIFRVYVNLPGGKHSANSNASMISPENLYESYRHKIATWFRHWMLMKFKWGWVKTLVPSEPQNSWDLWMFIPLKMVLIGIDPYPYDSSSSRRKGFPSYWLHHFKFGRPSPCTNPGLQYHSQNSPYWHYCRRVNHILHHIAIYPLVMTNIAMENGPFIDGLPRFTY